MILVQLTPLSPISLLLAYAPGGQGEMNLIALALNEDVAFIAIHHMLRVFLVISAAPIVFAWLKRREAGKKTGNSQS